MNPFYEMYRKIASSPEHDRMQRFIAPLKEHFGVNHFWYYRITDSGHYSYLGTHTGWNEFCFEKSWLGRFPCLRHPNALQSGIQLMKTDSDEKYQEMLQTAWDKFQINFNINLLSKTSEGMEAFGFATCLNDKKAEERLLNELNLLRYFTKLFRSKHQKLFDLLEDNQIDLSTQFGPLFYERPKSIVLEGDRNTFLRKIGHDPIPALTTRETDILKFISNGYPASYIAKQLRLSVRTVENYLVTIKGKLSCNSKVELIQKTQKIASIGYFQESGCN